MTLQTSCSFIHLYFFFFFIYSSSFISQNFSCFNHSIKFCRSSHPRGPSDHITTWHLPAAQIMIHISKEKEKEKRKFISQLPKFSLFCV